LLVAGELFFLLWKIRGNAKTKQNTTTDKKKIREIWAGVGNRQLFCFFKVEIDSL
jgi:hypothetical protein